MPSTDGRKSRDPTDWIEGPFKPFKPDVTAPVNDDETPKNTRSPDPIFGQTAQKPFNVDTLKPYDPHDDTDIHTWW